VCCCCPCIQAKLYARTQSRFLRCCSSPNECTMLCCVLGTSSVPLIGPCLTCCASAELRRQIVNAKLDKTDEHRCLSCCYSTQTDAESWGLSYFYTGCCLCCSLYQQSLLVSDKDEAMTNPCHCGAVLPHVLKENPDRVNLTKGDDGLKV